MTFLFTSKIVVGQNTCNCNKFPDLEISCKKNEILSGAKIYWSLNCDSSWLTFENRNYKKVLFSFDSVMLEMTGRIGIDFATSYNGYILLKNKLISGCCEPLEYILLDDKNADTVMNLGRILYYSDNLNDPFILKFRFTDFDHYENNTGFDFTLEILNLKTGKSKFIKQFSKELAQLFKQSEMIYPEELFNELTPLKTKLLLSVRYKNGNIWKVKELLIPR